MPVLRTTPRAASSTTGPSSVSTRTRPTPSRRPWPRTIRTPASSSGSAWWWSVQSWLASRIRAATSDQSGRTSTSPASPGARRASASRSAGRTISFDGVHPQNGHSPPTSARSTPTTVEPGLGQLAGGVLATGAEPEHHDVDLLRRVCPWRHPCIHRMMGRWTRCDEAVTTTRRTLLGAGLAGGAAPPWRPAATTRRSRRAAAETEPAERPAARPSPSADRRRRRRSTRRTGTRSRGSSCSTRRWPSSRRSSSPRTPTSLNAAITGYRDELGTDTEARPDHRLRARARRSEGGRGVPRRRGRPVRADRQHDDGARPDVRRPVAGSRRRGADHDPRLLLHRGEPAAAAPPHRRDVSQVTLYDDPATATVDEMVGRLVAGITPRDQGRRPHLGALEHRRPRPGPGDLRRARRAEPGAAQPVRRLRRRRARLLGRRRRPARPRLRLPRRRHPQVAVRPARHRRPLGPGLRTAHRVIPTLLRARLPRRVG